MPLLFLSHAAADRQLAQFCEDALREAVPGIDVFRTTRIDSIPAGESWLATIYDRLREAERVLVLITPTSVLRPWISFETGAAWVADKTMVPAVAGMAKEEVPEPLRSLQLRSLDNAEEAAQAFRELGGTLKDPRTFAAAVRALAEVGAHESLESQGWAYINFEGKRYAWDGPFEKLTRSSPVPIPEGLAEALVSAGYDTITGFSDDLWNEQGQGFKQIFEVDRHNRIHELVAVQRRVLMVRRKITVEPTT